MDDAIAAERAAELQKAEEAAAKVRLGAAATAGAGSGSGVVSAGAADRESGTGDVGKYMAAAKAKSSLKRARPDEGEAGADGDEA